MGGDRRAPRPSDAAAPMSLLGPTSRLSIAKGLPRCPASNVESIHADPTREVLEESGPTAKARMVIRARNMKPVWPCCPTSLA